MKIMMQPGGALLVMGVVAYFARFVLVKVPLIGGMLGWILTFGAIFGVVGGLYLLATARRRDGAA